MDIKKHQPVIDIPPVVRQVYSQLGASRAEGSQIPKSGMLLCVMAKSCPFSVGEIPPHPGHPHQLAVTVLNENMQQRQESWIRITYWKGIRKSIIRKPAEFLIETPRRSLAFQGINEKIVQDIEGESSLGFDNGGWEYT